MIKTDNSLLNLFIDMVKTQFLMRSFFFSLLLVLSNIAVSQTAKPDLVNTTGDSFSNDTYQLDWSVGETMISTYSTEIYILTQGFHQNVYLITSIEDFDKNIIMEVYPNPTSDYITLKVDGTLSGLLSYTMMDISGKPIKNGEIHDNEELYNMVDFANGVYLLNIIRNNKVIKSYRIIKN